MFFIQFRDLCGPDTLLYTEQAWFTEPENFFPPNYRRGRIHAASLEEAKAVEHELRCALIDGDWSAVPVTFEEF